MFQKGFGAYRYPGRAIYIADFDAKTPAVTNPKVIANEAFERNVTYLYPRWTKDHSAVVYHSSKSGRNQLYMYSLKDASTACVSADPKGNYISLTARRRRSRPLTGQGPLPAARSNVNA